MGDLGLLHALNSETFALDPANNKDLVDLLNEGSNMQLILNSLLHSADISNPMRPWEICTRYAQLCLEEFFAQGDLEKSAGIPVQTLNDRERVNLPNSQVGFIEFIIAPLAEKMVQLFPALFFLTDDVGSNITRWADEWIELSKPDAEAVSKTRTRVQKVVDKCKAAGPLGSEAAT